MKIVNINNLPKIIELFLKVDFYDHKQAEGTISATTLLKPIKEIILTERHYDEIEVDVSERLWSVLGSGVHAVMENMSYLHIEGDELIKEFLEKLITGRIKQEERLYAEVLGEKISGKFDLIIDDTLYDFKISSVWTYIFGSRFEEWTKQLSIYRWLYFQTYHEQLSEQAYIIFIARDWYRRDAESIETYPIFAMQEKPLKLMPLKETEEMIVYKIKEIQKYRQVPDDLLPDCSLEEIWFNEKLGAGIKCLDYCPVRHFCTQGIAEQVKAKIKRM